MTRAHVAPGASTRSAAGVCTRLLRRSTWRFLHPGRSARVRPADAGGLEVVGLDPTLLSKALAIRDWLLTEAAQLADPGQILPGLAERLIALGIPIDRIMSAIDLLHSEYAGDRALLDQRRGHDLSPASRMAPTAIGVYNESPFAHVHRTREWLLLDLAQTPDSRFNIIPDLKAAGYRHYLVVPIFFTNGYPPRPDLRDPRPGGIWRAGLAGSAVCDADDCGHDGDPRPPSPPRQGAAHLRWR